MPNPIVWKTRNSASCGSCSPRPRTTPPRPCAAGRTASIRLTLDEVCEIPLEDVCGVLSIGDELLTMVVLNLEGEIGGVDGPLLRRGERPPAGRFADWARAPAAAGDWSELEQSALTETGNILGCAYVSAITRLIDQPLMPVGALFHSGLRGQRAPAGAGGAGRRHRFGADLPHRVPPRGGGIELAAVVRSHRGPAHGHGERPGMIILRRKPA